MKNRFNLWAKNHSKLVTRKFGFIDVLMVAKRIDRLRDSY